MAKRILIIEDSLFIREVLIHLFESEGYEVCSFENSQTVVNIALLIPDIVLLDVNLLGSPKNGDEVCADLKRYPATANLPVILLSAEDNLEFIAMKCHADGFITKPFNAEVLLKTITESIK